MALDVTTARGRKEIASIAHKVARSKTTLDKAGKALTDDARAKIEAVNGERRKVRDTLDDLKERVRKPLDEWEEKEQKRKAALQERMQAFDKGRTYWKMSTDDIRAVITEVENIAIDESWQEIRGLAEEAKAEALEKYRADLSNAEAREEQEAELNRLRAEKEEREAKEQAEAEKREREEQERRAKEQEAADQRSRAESLIADITEVRNGTIGGQSQPYGVLIYELEQKVPEAMASGLGDHKDAVEAVRLAGIDHLKAQMEHDAERQSRAEEEERAKAEERARQEAIAEQKRKADEAAEAERKAQERREKNKRHREKILREIGEDIASIDAADLPGAMLEGKVRHVTVNL
ncbi:hypothetical protein [Roseovarius sp. MMSF_3281]|uniref:hypothetical protein n=1 Tax=Roseovarius sp. MMSF_3281 TaxID=3046694 RepID=UPI00273D5117|nr:hypothetical protein [Roseovarius sp. MMSF_3281]